MSAPNPSFPFGLHQIVVTNITGTTQVALPSSNRLMVKERYQTGEAPGDDALQAVASTFMAADWELEAKGISLEAMAVMTGRTLVTSGASPNEVKSLKASAGTRLPYFKIYGKSLGDGDDDVHILLYKCKLTEGPEATYQFGEFAGPSLKGIAVDDGVNGVYLPVINETADDLPSS
jgi:hypothetical protein